MTEKARVLFVDDERHILTALRALFRNHYDVRIAISGEEALQIVRDEPVHVIVSDQRMPKMLGAQLLARVKEISPQTMRLLLTGYSDMEAIMHSINEGEVFRFISKPWDNDDIRAIVANAANIALHGELHPYNEQPITVEAEQLTAPTEVTSSQPLIEQTETSIVTASHDSVRPAILLLDNTKDTLDTVTDLFAAQYRIFTANGLEQALEILGQHEIAVVVSDIQIHGQDVTDFIKFLKQQQPLIVAVVVAASLDSETAIGLINQGQIYRYLSKPVTRAVLHLSIQQAFRHYQTSKRKPWLLDRYQVEPVEEARNPSLTKNILTKLKLLRSRLLGHKLS